MKLITFFIFDIRLQVHEYIIVIKKRYQSIGTVVNSNNNTPIKPSVWSKQTKKPIINNMGMNNN
jgi:hypothetical protein